MTSDSAVGPRVDVAVRQEFDFPTVYRLQRQLAEAYDRMLQQGNANQLEANRARLSLTTAEAALAEAEAERDRFLAGELPLTDHLLELSLQTSARVSRLAILRDLHLLLAELNAHRF